MYYPRRNGQTIASGGIRVTIKIFPNCICQTTNFGVPNSYFTSNQLYQSYKIHIILSSWLILFFSALNPAVGMFSEAKISVDNNGKVTWRPKFDVNTNCNIDVKLWPWDQHKCTVLLSTWSHQISNIFYEIKKNNKPVSIII